MISIIVPYINRLDLTIRTISSLYQNVSNQDTQIVVYNNGAQDDFKPVLEYPFRARLSTYIEYDNKGIIHALKKGVQLADNDIICFFHNDILIWEKGFDIRIENTFNQKPNLGLMGLIGAEGVNSIGARMILLREREIAATGKPHRIYLFATKSNAQGREWGKCKCHSYAWEHHGLLLSDFSYASVLDACALFFRRKAFEDLLEKTTALDDFRPPNHWYDRNIPLELIKLGWKVGIIGIPFDHYSANTGHQTKSHQKATEEWAKKQQIPIDDKSIDMLSYDKGREEFESQWGPYLPCIVDNDGNYTWHGEG